MIARVAELIRSLRLAPHPEGGAFREAFRMLPAAGTPGAPTRAALTHIYYLLVAGEHSRWHRIAQSEVWSLYEGDPLELDWIAADWSTIERRRLDIVAPGCEPSAAVPAGCWQTARSSGAYSLVGCTVAPGFDFADFTLMSDDPVASERLRECFPGEGRFLLPTTA